MDNTAVAFTASGQFIIDDEPPPDANACALSPSLTVLGVDLGAELDLEFDDLRPWWEFELRFDACAAQASPLAIKTEECADWSTSVAAATDFSQPSRQPAPAIQRATANASVTLTTLNEAKSLIWSPSLAPAY